MMDEHNVKMFENIVLKGNIQTLRSRQYQQASNTAQYEASELYSVPDCQGDQTDDEMVMAHMEQRTLVGKPEE